MKKEQYDQSLLSHLFGELISFGAFTCMRICAQAHSDHSVTQEEMSSRPQTPVTDSQLLQQRQTAHVSSSSLDMKMKDTCTQARSKLPDVQNLIHDERPHCSPSAVTTPWLWDVEVTLCSSGSAPLRLFQRWSRSRRLPPPGRAPPSAAPRHCRPWTPTGRRLPSSPACAAAVHSPGTRPRWAYVQMWVKENLSETDHHRLRLS